MDLLSGTLEIPAPARVAASGGAAMLELLRAGPIQLGIGVGLLAFGLLLGRASVRRPLPAMVEDAPQPVEAPVALPRRVAALALGALLFAPGAWAQQALVTGESPRRPEDGGIFVPKASQRLLSIRTQLTWLFSAMALASYSMGER